MTGYAGMPGAVVPYYVGRDIPRETAKASMMLIFTIASFAGLVSGAALGILAWRLPLLAAVLFPAVLIGNALGDRASAGSTGCGDRLSGYPRRGGARSAAPAGLARQSGSTGPASTSASAQPVTISTRAASAAVAAAVERVRIVALGMAAILGCNP